MTLPRAALASGMLAMMALGSLACGERPGPTPADGTPTATDPPASVITDCFEMTVQSSAAPETIDNLLENDPTVLVGIFRGYDGAEWNTPDGHRPTRQEFQEKPARLHRPLAIEVQAHVRGDRSAGEHAFQRGGTLGCDTVSYDEPILVDDQRYVFFLMAVSDSEGRPAGDFSVIAAWPIGADDVVETQHEGRVPLADVIAAIERGVSATPSP